MAGHDELPLSEVREFADDAFVNRAFERHDKARDILHRLPAPGGKFRLLRAGGMGEVDLALVAGEAQREPFLGLAAVFAFPRLADDLARDVVLQPVGDFAQPLHGTDIGFLVQLPQRRRPRLFALVDAALRHLPCVGRVDMLRPLDAAADEGTAGAIEHQHADTRAIGEVFEAHTRRRTSDDGGRMISTYPSSVIRRPSSESQVCFGFSATAVIGISWMPWSAKVFAHLAMW